ncbi:oligosaccharide flippase family protein [Limisphaera sp. VF-2]|uniref:oligosaccharide flippase family protein n=1 Tax=Limisphaera sp. VF-2 TaxID=3400418 RepID=UPI003C295EA0
MSLRKQVLKGTASVALGEGIGYAASFLRNMILARLLSKADFGMAAVFGMVMSLLEFTAKLGVGRFLIRDKEGDDPTFVATGHTVQAVAAAISAACILAFAPLLARWFGIAEHAWALMILAGIVLLRGLQHLDVQRFERHLRFGPSAAVEAVPQLIITLAAWPLAVWLRDYRAVLILLVAKALLSFVLSHWLAEQEYRLTWKPEYGHRMLQFGWPLLLTGFLMFGIMQGDQFLVATFYSMSDLAPYAAAVTLVMAPQFVWGRVFNSVAFPLVARVQDNPTMFALRYRQVLGVMTLYATVSTAALMTGAEALMRCVYGPKYIGAGLLMAWLAAVAAFRALRMAVAVANLAKGDSQSQLLSNLGRASSLLPAFWLASQGQPLWTVAACGLLGELVATGICVWRLRSLYGLAPGLSLGAVVGTAGLAAACGWLGHQVATWPSWAALGLAALAAFGSGIATVALRRELRAEVNALLGRFQSVGLRAALQSWWTMSRQSGAATGAPSGQLMDRRQYVGDKA